MAQRLVRKPMIIKKKIEQIVYTKIQQNSSKSSPQSTAVYSIYTSEYIAPND